MAQKDAYRYFFPAGWALGFWGVLVWILFPMNLVSYPGSYHPQIMTGGFFLCFVCGFLMTAAPKFTSSFGPTKVDENISYLLISLLLFSVFLQKNIYFYTVTLSLFLFLISYLLRRFLNKQANPPDSFVFVGFGLLIGLVANIILLIAEFMTIPTAVHKLGKLLFLQAYILCLVLGVGSKLIPALLGWAPLPNTQTLYPQKSRIHFFSILAVLFILSYYIEILNHYFYAQLLRTFIILFITFRFWKIYRFPARKAYQSWWLWASAWSLLLAQTALVFLPKYHVHLLHVLLVSGLGLMTFMIAVRVTLSHGHHDLNIESKSKYLWMAAFLMSFAGLTRLSAGLLPQLYQSHLVYAAYTWILGLLFWGWIFLPRILKIKKNK